MDISTLSKQDLTVGMKQTLKALKRGDLSSVFVASDGAAKVIDPVIAACKELGVPYDESQTMEALGEAARIKVGAAAIGVRNTR